MANPRPRVRVPRTASAGETITIKTLISHPMESGQRKDRKTGELIPRKIINHFKVEFNGRQIFAADIEPAVSANPFFEFNVKIEESGTFAFSWTDDDGSVYTTEKNIKVEG